MHPIVRRIEQGQLREKIPSFRVGDTVDVHVRIREGEKERIQIFTGVVIARRHGGARETFTVRRTVQGEGVERVFPLHSPLVTDVQVRRSGRVRRAKLYYLRDRFGKSARLKQIRRRLGDAVADAPEPAPTPDPEPTADAATEKAENAPASVASSE